MPIAKEESSDTDLPVSASDGRRSPRRWRSERRRRRNEALALSLGATSVALVLDVMVPVVEEKEWRRSTQAMGGMPR